jgi:hypothetical protein
MSVILVTWEAEIGRIKVQGWAGGEESEILSQKYPT